MPPRVKGTAEASAELKQKIEARLAGTADAPAPGQPLPEAPPANAQPPQEQPQTEPKGPERAAVEQAPGEPPQAAPEKPPDAPAVPEEAQQVLYSHAMAQVEALQAENERLRTGYDYVRSRMDDAVRINGELRKQLESPGRPAQPEQGASPAPGSLEGDAIQAMRERYGDDYVADIAAVAERVAAQKLQAITPRIDELSGHAQRTNQAALTRAQQEYDLALSEAVPDWNVLVNSPYLEQWLTRHPWGDTFARVLFGEGRPGTAGTVGQVADVLNQFRTVLQQIPPNGGGAPRQGAQDPSAAASQSRAQAAANADVGKVVTTRPTPGATGPVYTQADFVKETNEAKTNPDKLREVMKKMEAHVAAGTFKVTSGRPSPNYS